MTDRGASGAAGRAQAKRSVAETSSCTMPGSLAEWPRYHYVSRRTFCPFHACSAGQCTPGCLGARLAFERSAADLERYWPVWQARQQMVAA